MKISTSKLGVAIYLAGAAAYPAAAASQEKPADPGLNLEEVLVTTARFRTEALTDVPIAISTLSGDQLAERGLNNVQDIARSVPTMEFRTNASNKDRSVFIRGVGTISTSPGVEPSVSTVLDGVVLARPGQSTLELFDIERIEVLRGPQGSLFGRNASAGVVNIVSKTPTNKSVQTLETTITDDEEYRVRLLSSGAIVPDKLLYSVGGLYSAYDGNVKNVLSGSTVNGSDRKGATGKLVFRPNDDLTLTLSADYADTKDDVPTGVFYSTDRVAFQTGFVTTNPTLAAILASTNITPSLSNRDVSANFDSYVADKNYGGLAHADWRVGDFMLTSITGYRKWENHQVQDWDAFNTQTVPGAPSSIAQGIDDGWVHSNQLSQEFRLTSPGEQFLDYVLGLYFLTSDTDEDYHRQIIRLVSGQLVTNNGWAEFGTSTKNYAIFGDGTLNFTERFRGIIGGRVLKDELSFYHRRVADTGPAGVTGIAGDISNTGETDDTDYTARVGLQYDVAADVVTYATFSRGYKGKAYNTFFNMPQNAVDPLDPETSVSYEMGLKTDILDHRLQASLAVYLTEFEGYQANFQDTFQGAIVTRLTNAGDVSSRGVELDVTYRPLDALTLTFNSAYTDAKIDEFNCPANATCTNFNGQPLPFAPRWKLFGDITYVMPLSDKLDLELQADATYRSETQYSITQTPDTIQPAYTIGNASIAVSGYAGFGDWQLRAFVRNFADQDYMAALQYGAAAGAAAFIPRDDQRYFGLSARVHF